MTDGLDMARCGALVHREDGSQNLAVDGPGPTSAGS